MIDAVGHRDAEGVAGQLAVEVGDHLADGLRRAGGRGDDVDRRGAGAVGVGVDLVGHALVVGVGVAGGHQALLDPERLVEHLGHRGQAVGGARGVGDDPVGRLERLVVDAQDDRGVELVLGRGAEDRPARRRRRGASGATALLVKKPVDSRATWHLRAFQGRLAGSFSWVIRISLPLTTSAPSPASTVPLKRPWTLSYFRSRARCLASERSLIATTSNSSGRAAMTRKTSRPIRPNPLIPTRTAMRPAPASSLGRTDSGILSAPAWCPPTARTFAPSLRVRIIGAGRRTKSTHGAGHRERPRPGLDPRARPSLGLRGAGRLGQRGVSALPSRWSRCIPEKKLAGYSRLTL